MKKLKVLLLSLIVTAILLFAYFTSLSLLAAYIIIFSFIYIFTLWVLDFDINPIGFLTLLLFPALVVANASLLLLVYTPNVVNFLHLSSLLIQNGLTVIVYLAVATLAAYSSIISMNIFNVARYKRIPLLQAAQTIVYIYTIIGGYITFTLIHHFFLSQWYILVPFYLLTCVYLFFLNTWSIKMQPREMLLFTFIGTIIMAQLILVLLTFPLAQYVFTIAITAGVYIYNGIITHIDKRNLIQRITIEYGTIALALTILILFTSHWGIAGNIIGR